MPECDYCEESFDGEGTYVAHLQSEHEGELSRVDQRRVEEFEAGGRSLPYGAIALVVIIVAAFAVVAYVIVSMGSVGGSDGPTNAGSIHEHGTIEIVVDGEELDLYADRYAKQDPNFHFHGGETGDEYVWHVHAQQVTLGYALETLGMEVTDDGTELTIDGTAYDADDPDTEISVTVNGESVDPGDYVLRGVEPVPEAAAGGGDTVLVEVETG